MSSWRINQHYGYGAGHVRISGEGHAGSRNAVRDGLVTLLLETVEGGPVAAARRILSESPGIMLGVVLIASFAYTILQDHSDNSAIEVVMFDGTRPVPEPIEEELPPLPPPVEIAEVKPEPVKPIALPEPVIPKATPKPKPPPPPALAERPKPPPPPVAKPRPRPLPAPVIPKIARVEPPKPKPVVRPDRPKRERPKAIARPKVAIERVALAPKKPAPKVQRIARANTPRPTMPTNTPRLNAPAAPRPGTPPPPPKRSFRVAKAQPGQGERPRAMPGLAPAPIQRAVPQATAGPRPERTKGARPKAPRMPRAVAPAMARVPVAPAPALPTQNRQTRDLPRSPERSARMPLAVPTQRAPKPPVSVPQLASRASRAAPSANYASAEQRPGVDGVPLGELAACVSDRDEDRLKQAIVAAVKTQEQCVSRKGTYRFIETKNLNAFLMWIDRAPSRAVEDRCAELRYALECLKGASQQAAR